MFSSATAEWSTPQDFFDELNKEFGFNLDPCCTHENAKCEDHYTKEDNGLEQNWGGADRICQPSVRKGDRPLGQEIVRGKSQGRYNGGNVNPSEDRYPVFPRVYLPQGPTNPVYPGSPQIRRIRQLGPFPVNGSNF